MEDKIGFEYCVRAKPLNTSSQIDIKQHKVNLIQFVLTIDGDSTFFRFKRATAMNISTELYPLYTNSHHHLTSLYHITIPSVRNKGNARCSTSIRAVLQRRPVTPGDLLSHLGDWD